MRIGSPNRGKANKLQAQVYPMIASDLTRATVLQVLLYELRNTCDLLYRPLGSQDPKFLV